ncbi:thioesterase [Streptomyces sp. Ru73]|uniref:acyl-CoA thioesterase n=1 Tax=Streptomyces sp. Ru73 TaxID=2080748 RepID=UPI000CDD78D6|nr:acyl-CoA thioesterase [Streptomyces sp. Ru73]POX42223.1 thioesterase [Streptomyces sp. Ru73]
MALPFAVEITVRGYETDAQGHLNSSVYMQYAEHARWSLLQAAGIRQSDLLDQGVGPVNLETTVRFRRELRAGDEVSVTCRFEWGEGKTYRIEQEVLRADGEVAAEVVSVCGIIDLTARRLLSDPAQFFRSTAKDLTLFNL